MDATRRSFLGGLLGLLAAPLAFLGRGSVEVPLVGLKDLHTTNIPDLTTMDNVVKTTHKTYGLGFRVPHEMIEDDQWDLIYRMAHDLADAQRDHQLRQTQEVLDSTFGPGTVDVLTPREHT